MAVLSLGASSSGAPIPSAPGALPLLGHSPALLRDPLSLLRALPEHGDLVRLRFGAGEFVVACTPELTQELLHDPRTFDKGGFFFDRLRELTGNNVASCPHAEHAAQRRRVQPIFRRDRMPGYGRTIVEQAAAVTGGWRDNAVIDVFPDMLRIGARCAAVLVFGATFPPKALERTISDITLYVEGIFTRMFLPPVLARLPLPANLRYGQVRKRLRHAVSAMVDGYGRADHPAGGDLLTALMDCAPTPGDPESPAGLVDQLTLMLMAGTESTATTVAWALHELSRDPVLQHRVQIEVDAAIGSGTPTHAHIGHLELTGRVLTETLRKYPAAWILSRVATRDTILGGHRIPSGTTLVFSPYLLHHRPDVFPDPDRFDPDRWLPANVCPVMRKALIPFGGGTRKCAGDTFAMVESALVLASILTRWSLDPVPDTRVRPAAYGALQPDGLRLRAVGRSG
ncbi:cytochrome P450 [Nocardia seriolae]|uniref:cytochrome P450 n=1 Tax=Nocardia seriolae TaxID=37332 RepID=UPI000690102E|nr:cytochrome P450 [Nocardia seriolae]MTJ64877.1 cytochrome P450 [Nocardia seriolae]MTJ70902.1 cytochrome P450 [Nocardia seriolae]MTJ89693.1 cytochrome P450 [Nocardia seriolae]MTK33668.1 cytochrome P450 [Nocardia seriolae]MTK42820.1 cytochrome P450 [Nocardia seriolae]